MESFADDLNTRRGIVSGRVALLPRSTEIQPHAAPIRPPTHLQSEEPKTCPRGHVFQIFPRPYLAGPGHGKDL